MVFDATHFGPVAGRAGERPRAVSASSCQCSPRAAVAVGIAGLFMETIRILPGPVRWPECLASAADAGAAGDPQTDRSAGQAAPAGNDPGVIAHLVLFRFKSGPQAASRRALARWRRRWTSCPTRFLRSSAGSMAVTIPTMTRLGLWPFRAVPVRDDLQSYFRASAHVALPSGSEVGFVLRISKHPQCRNI